MALDVRSVGSYSTPGTTSPHTVPTPGTFQSGDLLVAIFEFQTGANTNHITATGWTEIAWLSITATVGRTALSVMGRISDGGEGSSVDFTVAGTVNHVSGRMLAIQDHGLSTVGDAVVGTISSGAGTGSPQTNTISGITVDAGSMVLMVGSSGRDADWTTEFSNWTNSNLTSITERMDNGTLTASGGGFGLATGMKSSQGATGNSTYDQANSYDWICVHVGVKPAAGGTTYTKQNIGISAFVGSGADASTLSVVGKGESSRVGYYQRRTDFATFFGRTPISQRAASKFVASSSQLRAVSVWVRHSGSPTDDARVSLYTDSSGNPGSAIASVDFDTTTTMTLYEKDLVASLTVGTSYWIVFERTGALDDTNRYETSYVWDGYTGSPLSTAKEYTSGAWDTLTNHHYIEVHQSGFTGGGTSQKTSAGKAGLAASAFVAGGADATTFNRSGAGVSAFTASGADAVTHAETGTAVSVFVGSGSDATTHAEAAMAIAPFVGSGIDAATYVEVATGLFTSPVRDDFNRANEGPPPSSNWSQIYAGGYPYSFTVVSNELVVGGTQDTWGGGYYWNPATYGPDAEAYVRYATDATETELLLFVRLVQPGSSAYDGYAARWKPASNEINLYRVTDDAYTLLASSEGPNAANDGDLLGVSVIGGRLKAYKNEGSGWVEVLDVWDVVHAGAGYIGIISMGGNVLDDFGGGAVTMGSRRVASGTVERSKFGTGISPFVGSGADASIFNRSGSGVSNRVASGADAVIFAETGAGIAPLTGSGDAIWNVSRANAAVSAFAGSGADASAFAETGAGISTRTTTGADAVTSAEAGTGAASFIGTADATWNVGRANAAISAHTGSGADVVTFAETGAGISARVATGADVATHAKTATAIAPLTGSGADAITFVEVATGVFTSPILDNFNRTNEGPPPSSSWGASPDAEDTAGISVVSNQAQAGASDTYGGASWNTEFGEDQESCYTIRTVGDHWIWARVQQIGAGTEDGYAVEWESATSTIRIFRVLNDAYSTLATFTSHAQATGNRIGIAVVGASIHAYKDTGSGWTFVGSAFDVSVKGPGKIAISLPANATADDFGGGLITMGSHRVAAGVAVKETEGAFLKAGTAVIGP